MILLTLMLILEFFINSANTIDHIKRFEKDRFGGDFTSGANSPTELNKIKQNKISQYLCELVRKTKLVQRNPDFVWSIGS